MDALEQIKGFASTETTRKIVVNDDNGNPCTFLIRKFSSAQDGIKFAKLVEKRIESLKTYDNAMAVYIPTSVVELYPEQFKDATPCKDPKHEGKSTITVCSEEEVGLATTLENGIVEPKMDWPSAVIYTRLNFRLCGTLTKEINKTNGEYAIEEAKNDSGETDSTD